MQTASTRTDVTDIERIARKRASAKMGWYTHLLVYLAVNTFLMVLALTSGRYWALFPAVGWGIGLAAHGLAVLFTSQGAGLRERMVERERQRLQP